MLLCLPLPQRRAGSYYFSVPVGSSRELPVLNSPLLFSLFLSLSLSLSFSCKFDRRVPPFIPALRCTCFQLDPRRPARNTRSSSLSVLCIVCV